MLKVLEKRNKAVSLLPFRFKRSRVREVLGCFLRIDELSDGSVFFEEMKK